MQNREQHSPTITESYCEYHHCKIVDGRCESDAYESTRDLNKELLDALKKLTSEAEKRAGVPKDFIKQARATIAAAEAA